MHTDVVILGAGASGLCCAIACAGRGRDTLVIDHGPKAARKVLAAGGGRANCTNTDIRAADYHCANPHFVKSALARFSPADFLDWIHAGGVATVEEPGGKVFCRDGARALTRFLLSEARRAGARIQLGTRVRDARKDGDVFVIDTEAGSVRATSLVLALGGKSWPGLGATDCGYTLARGFGLPATELRPGLTPLLAGPDMAPLCRELAGVSLPVRLTGPCDITGELLFTHKGVSGPAVLDASLFWREGETLSIDWLPGRDPEAILAEAGRQEIKNALSGCLPKRLATALCQHLGATGPAAGLSPKARRKLAASLAAFSFAPARAEGYAKAEVTLGGVTVDRISSKTLAASDIPGLYVIGELLDVTGRLGGFNLHWAWASGFAAGGDI
ncbi:HI0933 family protein [Solidesulfovibrio fructosivorans JJ]]|uniref:HI0933 family protein n=1 Tax=Solidesulfovibrio fructosivorans JJ] TaxID=596151 RepID=E1JZW7_SOLFR|nr:aminoacetone oxidase family FAD-binding enzyme [Solidesulfovibrio fructosivorans]EFL50062.1 HI0933 family protein [Solidesulfovibrio fructosivorans JJ]]